jgi:hypothetical protein
LAVLSFLFNIGGIIPRYLGVMPLTIILCTCCLRVPEAVLYTAAVTAVVCSILDFIIAGTVAVCAEDDNSDCIPKEYQIVLVIGGLLWSATAVLIVKIPQNDPASKQAIFDQNQKVAGHDKV